jgi:glycosyltransferase involved in cell wall biosynthesis
MILKVLNNKMFGQLSMDISRKAQNKTIPNSRSGKLPHDLQPFEELEITNDEQFASIMAKLSGGLFLEEAMFLTKLASQVDSGCIVEVGSFRGKSSVALSYGARLGKKNIDVYCVEPHKPFTGVYGGEFGPQDRGEFYRAMLATGSFKNTSLINLSSEKVSTNWSEKIALCFIDGDHTYDAVKRDWKCWFEHISPGGIVVFDDAKDPNIGPSKVVKEIIKELGWERVAAPHKFIALRCPTQDEISPVITQSSKNILIACEKIIASGGLLRFERLAKAMLPLGAKLTIVELNEDKSENINPRPLKHLELIAFEEAIQLTWDAIMIPGAGFSNTIIDKFNVFRDPKFGIRVQHVLNDQIHRERFLAVNKSFSPDIVIFNNQYWPVGSYTDFQGKQFHILIGAVDIEFFHTTERRKVSEKEKFIVGGQASKNADVLIQAVENMPDNIHLKLFGNVSKATRKTGSKLEEIGRLEYVGYLDDEGLFKFYSSVDLIVSTETFAGWANICAEAAACGVPIVCTSAGTSVFARDGETAIVIEDADIESIGNAILKIIKNPTEANKIADAARLEIENFSFTSYAKDILKLINVPPKSHYVRAPELGLFGKWALSDRFIGMDTLFNVCTNKTILDLGAAEGIVSLELLKRSASKVTGFEFDIDRVEFANILIKKSGYKNIANITQANLVPWDTFIESNNNALDFSYDIVLYLGIHHHLGEQENRVTSLLGAIKLAKEYFVIRTPHAFWEQDSILALITKAGWVPLHAMSENKGKEYMGGLVIFKKGIQYQTNINNDGNNYQTEQSS